MLNGIYHVRLATSDGHVSEGQWVMDNHLLSGNDTQARYQGQCHLSGEHVTIRLAIDRHPESASALWGRLQQGFLALNGHLDSDRQHFSLSGDIEQHPGVYVTLNARWMSALD